MDDNNISFMFPLSGEPGQLDELCSNQTQQEANAHLEGFEKGYNEGHEKGLIVGREEGLAVVKSDLETAASQVNERLSALMQSLTDYRELQKGDHRQKLVGTVKTLCEAVIQKELSISPDSLVSLIDSALKSFEVDSDITITMHPLEAKFLSTHFFDTSHRLRFKSDEGACLGDCKIESKYQSTDVSIRYRSEEAFSLLEDKLYKRL